MGSTSFLGFSCPDLLLVLLVIPRNLLLTYFFVFFASVGTFSGSLLFLCLILGSL